MSETKTEHWRRRAAELNKIRKAELCAMLRRLGGMGGIHPPEKWRKDEVITAIVDIEWGRLPDDQKAPTPPLMSPPCDQCGGGQNAQAHGAGGHQYVNTWDPDVTWVRADQEPAEVQPTEANATAEPSHVWLGDLSGFEVAPMVRSDGAVVLALHHRCGWAEVVRTDGICDDASTYLANLVVMAVKERKTHNCAATAAARPEVRAAVARGYEAVARGDKIGAMLAQTEAITHMVTPRRPVVLEGGTGPGVLADQTRERPDLIPPTFTVHVNRCTPGEAGHTDCEGEGRC